MGTAAHVFARKLSTPQILQGLHAVPSTAKVGQRQGSRRQ
jgi:hypothetical protein